MTAIAIISLFITPICPRASGGIIVALFFAASMASHIYTTTFFFAYIAVIGVLAYRDTGPYPVLLMLMAILGVTSAAIMYDQPAVGWWGCLAIIANHALYLCAPVFAGKALGWRERALQASVLQYRTRQMELERHNAKQRVAVASRIHDVITGNMVLISMLSHQMMHIRELDEKTASLLGIIDDLALQTLDGTREAVTLLRDEPSAELISPHAHADANSAVTEIRTLAQRHYMYLEQLGYHGTLEVEDSTSIDAPSKETVEELTSLLQEIFINIIRHASKTKEYELHVLFHENTCRIVQSNFIEPNHQINGGNSGKGLIYHHALVNEMGGNLVHTLEENEWVLLIDLPLDRKEANVNSAAKTISSTTWIK